MYLSDDVLKEEHQSERLAVHSWEEKGLISIRGCYYEWKRGSRMGSREGCFGLA